LILFEGKGKHCYIRKFRFKNISSFNFSKSSLNALVKNLLEQKRKRENRFTLVSVCQIIADVVRSREIITFSWSELDVVNTNTSCLKSLLEQVFFSHDKKSRPISGRKKRGINKTNKVFLWCVNVCLSGSYSAIKMMDLPILLFILIGLFNNYKIIH
jgi:hypothetical protein